MTSPSTFFIFYSFIGNIQNFIKEKILSVHEACTIRELRIYREGNRRNKIKGPNKFYNRAARSKAPNS
jgi:hypothetical protein